MDQDRIIPNPPPGFVLDNLPPGFILDAPPPPEGFVLDQSEEEKAFGLPLMYQGVPIQGTTDFARRGVATPATIVAPEPSGEGPRGEKGVSTEIKGPSFWQQLKSEIIDKIGGTAEGVLGLGTAYGAIPFAGAELVAKLQTGAQQAGFKPMSVKKAWEESKKRLEELTYQPKTQFGQIVTSVGAAPLTAFTGIVDKAIQEIPQENLPFPLNKIDQEEAQAIMEMMGTIGAFALLPKISGRIKGYIDRLVIDEKPLLAKDLKIMADDVAEIPPETKAKINSIPDETVMVQDTKRVLARGRDLARAAVKKAPTPASEVVKEAQQAGREVELFASPFQDRPLQRELAEERARAKEQAAINKQADAIAIPERVVRNAGEDPRLEAKTDKYKFAKTQEELQANKDILQSLIDKGTPMSEVLRVANEEMFQPGGMLPESLNTYADTLAKARDIEMANRLAQRTPEERRAEDQALARGRDLARAAAKEAPTESEVEKLPATIPMSRLDEVRVAAIERMREIYDKLRAEKRTVFTPEENKAVLVGDVAWAKPRSGVNVLSEIERLSQEGLDTLDIVDALNGRVGMVLTYEHVAAVKEKLGIPNPYLTPTGKEALAGIRRINPEFEKWVKSRRVSEVVSAGEKPISGEGVEFLPQEGALPHAGEAVSAESLSRQKKYGFYKYDSVSKSLTPIIGSEAVDIPVGKNEVKIQLNKNTGKYDVLDIGENASIPENIKDLLKRQRETEKQKPPIPLEKMTAADIKGDKKFIDDNLMRIAQEENYPVDHPTYDIAELLGDAYRNFNAEKNPSKSPEQNLRDFVRNRKILNTSPDREKAIRSATGKSPASPVQYPEKETAGMIPATETIRSPHEAREMEAKESAFDFLESIASENPELKKTIDSLREGKTLEEVAKEEGISVSQAHKRRVDLRESAQTVLDVLSGDEATREKIGKRYQELEGKITSGKTLSPKETIEHKILQEQGKIRREFIKKMTGELTGDEFDKLSSTLAKKMEKDIGPTKGPRVGLMIETTPSVTGLQKAEEFKFPEEIETRYLAAKKIPKLNARQRVRQFLIDVKNGITRTYPNLPVGPEFIEVKQTLKRLEKQPGIIADKIYRTYKSIVYNLDENQYDLMNRKAVVADLLREADMGHKLPFGFDEKSIREVSAKLDDIIKNNVAVNNALKARADLWDAIRKQYAYWREKVGHNVEDILTKQDYFRHKVIEYATDRERSMGMGKRLRLHVGQEFLKPRAGSEMDILSDLISADYEVMSRMLYDIEEAKALSKIRDIADKSEQFKAEAKAKGIPIEEVIPKEYTKWQPKEGHVFYVADTIPAKIAEKILTEELSDIGVVKDKLRKSLAMGRERTTWIIKNELADTLDHLGSRKDASLLGKGFKKINTAWKKWTLLSPRRVIKYNLRNLSGDADKAFVGNTSGFTKAPRSFRELFEVYFGDRPLTGELKEFSDRGGLQTTLQVQEIGEIPKLPIFKNIYQQSKLNNLNIFKKYWNSVYRGTNFRESILRYANYLDYLEQMKGNPEGRPKNFGASLPGEIMGLSDIRDRAFRLSNELLGAYDEISPIGQNLREKYFPFWSWKELNTKSYIRLIKNMANNNEATIKTAKNLLSGAGKVGTSVGAKTLVGIGRFAIKAFGLTAMLAAYNEFFFKDEEKDLPENVRGRLHIILGRDKDGKVRYFSRLGALGDFLEWFGLDAGYHTVSDYLNGRKTIKEIALDMAKSPVNVIVSGMSPFIKTPIETLMRRSLFPDAFDPKLIRDRGAYLARQINLEDEYKAISGKPGRPYFSTLTQTAIYKSDPLESAYYDFLDIKRNYLKSIGRGNEGSYLSPSSTALYNMKLAYRYGEQDKVKKYIDEYKKIVAMQHKGVGSNELEKLVRRGIEQSFNTMHPLFGIKKDTWKTYVNSLDQEAKETLVKALRFYNEVILGKSKVD